MCSFRIAALHFHNRVNNAWTDQWAAFFSKPLAKIGMCCVIMADLDDRIHSGGLGGIFENPAPEVTPAVPKVNRFFRGVSVHTHRDANGVQYFTCWHYRECDCQT